MDNTDPVIYIGYAYTTFNGNRNPMDSANDNTSSTIYIWYVHTSSYDSTNSMDNTDSAIYIGYAYAAFNGILNPMDNTDTDDITRPPIKTYKHPSMTARTSWLT